MPVTRASVSAWGTVPGPVAVTVPGASDLRSAAVTSRTQSAALALAASTLVYSPVTGCHTYYLLIRCVSHVLTSVSWVPYSGTCEG